MSLVCLLGALEQSIAAAYSSFCPPPVFDKSSLSCSSGIRSLAHSRCGDTSVSAPDPAKAAALAVSEPAAAVEHTAPAGEPAEHKSKPGQAATQEEVKMVCAALAGHYTQFYHCRRGHMFVVGGCGTMVEHGRCPDCGKRVGPRSKCRRADR